ncbi:hypothetical protein ABG768_008495, partial [Culter alburnus]
VAKTYYALKEDSNCADLSIQVTVERKVERKQKKVETSNSKKPSKDSEERNLEEDFTQLGSEWFDAHSRRGENKQNYVVYTVCVSLSQGRKLSGMAIADITLLSGFEAINTDLERVSHNLIQKLLT